MAASGSGNNRFALACAGMRHFMAEHNRPVRMGDLVVGSSSFQPLLQLQLSPVPVPVVATAPAPAWETGTSTLPLFPIRAGSESSDEIIISPEEDKATLTIFFQGKVATFPNFPANRARELMQMAASVTRNAPEKGVTTVVPEMAAEMAAGAGMPPIARKLTLQRFLRKRKNRITGTDDPDQNQDASPWKKRDSTGASNPAEEVPDDDASWLRL